MWVNKNVNAVIALSLCLCIPNVIASTIPNWLTNPTIKDGFAAVDCVKFSGNWSSDSKISSANARIALAQQIDIKVESLDETYDTRESNQAGTNVSTKFSSVSKQHTKQVLAGSRIVKTEIVTISGTEYYCALATLDPNQTKQVFELIVGSSNKTLDTELESKLFEQFKSENGQVKNTVKQLINQ